MDKTPICVLCCRNHHKLDIFHRVEKWNGRYYQKGALWQVGVKIYLWVTVALPAHGASPLFLKPNNTNVLARMTRPRILEEVALELGLTQGRGHYAHLRCHGTSDRQYERHSTYIFSLLLLTSPDEAFLDLLRYLKERVSQTAEDDADLLQAEVRQNGSGGGSVDVEQHVPKEEVLAIPLEQDIGGEDDWEDEDERPAKGDVPRFLPRPPPTDGAGNKFRYCCSHQWLPFITSHLVCVR
jgi:hypothetical protein